MPIIAVPYVNKLGFDCVGGNISVLDVSVYNVSNDDVTFPHPTLLRNTAWNATGNSILLTANTINEITGKG